ncbi:uncharacterized protein LOC113231099 isoform X2 [Hyposmocoma kahamanoa]|uniref:uncharacterized protein LOC113231099 isoform X2 n=1 Tax=Hyposmocoma kahamanoa TaxID=1477025 RepID=UPI000E6D93C2|nr:uncharacterized protein LOC113231099 isoform X2 [Hyposmocoma kahamanoa]
MNVIGIFVFGLSAISVAVCMTTPPPVSISWPWGDWKPTGSTPTTIRGIQPETSASPIQRGNRSSTVGRQTEAAHNSGITAVVGLECKRIDT